MEWIATIFGWLFPDLIQKAGEDQIRERKEKTLCLLENQLKAGEVKSAVITSHNVTEKAEIKFKNFYFLTVQKTGSDVHREFSSIRELNKYLEENTKFRSGDFV